MSEAEELRVKQEPPERSEAEEDQAGAAQQAQGKEADGPQEGLMTFGDHLEVLRRMAFRILGLTLVLAVGIFCVKDLAFELLLAPSHYDFVTYRAIERLLGACGMDFHFEAFRVDLISTELSAQFMTHISTSIYLALLLASPYIVFELFRFVSPALYENERRRSVVIVGWVYVLFLLGVLMSYFVLFPVSFRFLGTYQVAEAVVNQITLSSYISTFLTLTLMMALVFQIPVLSLLLSRMGLLSAGFMARYRKHAFLLICIVAAIITPPDLFTLVLVSLPMYGLYEVSIQVVRRAER